MLAGLAVVVLIGGVVGGWLLLRPDGPPELSRSASDDGLPKLKRKTTPEQVSEAVKLRPISGDQLCDAIPDDFRKTLVTDGKYGGKDASTSAATEDEKRAACSWSNNKMDVGDGVIGHRTLEISVAAQNKERQNALEYAKEQFADNKESHERRVNVRDGKRIDGKTTGSAFGELQPLKYGDESYGQSSIGLTGLKAKVYVRQGPWMIEVEYGGDNRSGRKYPVGDEVRAAAGKVAEHIVTLMGKSADKVKLTGPCATVAVEAIESAFFPAVSGPTVSTNDGSVKQTICTWRVSEKVPHEPGQEYTSRGGELRAHVADWGDASNARFQFDRDAKKFDRYLAKGGIGNDRIHTNYQPREDVSGLGDKAFAVVSSTAKLYGDDKEPMVEIMVKALSGTKTVDFTFRGTTTGGGVVGAEGYQAPIFEPDVAEQAVLKMAKPFVTGLK